MYRQRIGQPQYQQLKIEGHLRVCGNEEFRMFPLPQMRSLEAIFPLLRQSITFSKILFFLQLLLNGITNLRNSNSIPVFKEKILNFIRPSPNSIFDICNPKGIKLITRLRLGLSHLREHKFKHSFQDTLNPLCKCGQDMESIT